MCLCVYTCTCCSHTLKPIVLPDDKTSQPLHKETGLMHITTADISRWELQATPKRGKIFFFELLASLSPFIMMLWMSPAQFLRKLKFPGGEISCWHLHLESQIGKENPSCSAQIQKSSDLHCYLWLWFACSIGKITAAEEMVINGCSDCCGSCAPKPLCANVW